MEDREVWLVLYQAILSNNYATQPALAAEHADNALEEYKHRWAPEYFEPANEQ